MYEGTLQKYLMNLTIVLLVLYGFSIGKILHLKAPPLHPTLVCCGAFRLFKLQQHYIQILRYLCLKLGRKHKTAVARVSLVPRI